MNNKIDKKNKYIIILIAISIFVLLLPIIVHIFSPKFYSEITADGILGYISTIFSSVSTIIISIVAIFQSNKANDLSLKLSEIEDNRYKIEMRPFFLITDWKVYKKNYDELIFNPTKLSIEISHIKDDDVLCLELVLQNTTKSFITVSYYSSVCNEQKNYWLNSKCNQDNSKISIPEESNNSIIFYADYNKFEKYKNKMITLEFNLENIIGEVYREIVDIFIIDIVSQKVNGKEEEYFCQLIPQNYRVGKFVGLYEIKWE